MLLFSATGVWERLQCRGEPPPSLQEHTATAHDSRLYVFGGEATALSSETPLWIYDTEVSARGSAEPHKPREDVMVMVVEIALWDT